MSEVIRKVDSNEEYHSSGYLGKSKLMKILDCPAKFKYALEHPPKPTPTLEFGTAVHMAVLEPEKFNEKYYVLPEDFNLRTNANKEIYQSVLDKGQTPISFADYEKVMGMCRSVHKTRYADTLLKGEHEMSYYWTDKLTNVKISCRPDSRRDIRKGVEGLIVDLKTCTNADTDSFMRDAVKFGYDIQAAQYKEGCELYYGYPHKFAFVAVEKEPPYAVNLLVADDFFIQRGKDRFRECLGLVKHCTDTDNWWGYNGEDGELNALGLPAYLLKEIE